MKGVTIWIWLIAGIVIGMLMFVLALQFIKFITEAQERELGKQNLDDLSSNINGLCGSRAGTSLTKTVSLPDKLNVIYATNDVKLQSNATRTYGINLCMVFANEVVCDNLNCILEMETITNQESLQTLLNQFLGKFGTNSYTVKVLKTDCGVAVLSQDSKTTCALNNTLT